MPPAPGNPLCTATRPAASSSSRKQEHPELTFLVPAGTAGHQHVATSPFPSTPSPQFRCVLYSGAPQRTSTSSLVSLMSLRMAGFSPQAESPGHLGSAVCPSCPWDICHICPTSLLDTQALPPQSLSPSSSYSRAISSSLAEGPSAHC